MSHHDGVLANDVGSAFRADVNSFIAAYLSRFSGTTDPATLVAYQRFIRTDLGVAWRRNAANSANLLDDTLAETLVVAKSGTFTAGLADFRRAFICTGTWSLAFSAAATLTDGWWCAVKNSGSGTIALDPNASETIDGVATLALAAGQSCIVYCDGANLHAIGNIGVADMPSILCTQAGGALTFAGSAFPLTFRSATLTDGSVSTIIADPADLGLPSGGTLGFVTTVQGRIVVAEMNNAGVSEYAICNLAGGLQLDETNLISTTAIDTGSDASNVWYSTTARTNLPYRIVGVVDVVNTAGAWGDPVLVQPVGGNAVTAMGSFGFGQTRQNLTASRALSTTYYNTKDKPIHVYVAASSTANPASVDLTITGPNGAIVVTGSTVAPGTYSVVDAIILPGESYSAAILATGTLQKWHEIR